MDSSEYFILKISRLLKPNARFSLIVPKSILFYSNWELSRQFILSKKLQLLCDAGLAFPEVNLESIVFCLDNRAIENSEVRIERFEPLKKVNAKKELVKLNSINQGLMQQNNVLILTDIDPISQNIIDKIWAKNSYLKDFERQVFRGLYIPDAEKEKIMGKGETLFVNKVPDVDAFQFKKIVKIDLNLQEKDYSNKINLLSVDRLVIKVMRGKRLKATFAPKNVLTTEKLVNLTVKDLNLKYVLAILNAKLSSFYLQKVLFSDTTETSRVMDDCYLSKIPLLAISEKEQTEIANKVDIIMANYQKINQLSSKFLRIIQSELKFPKISERLEKWYKLDWTSFQDELTRLKTPIPLKTRLEWIDLFEDQQKEPLTLFNQIQSLENELDTMVFGLYGLGAEERKMVEN